MSAYNELRMSGANARIIIQNCHAIMRHKFRHVPLWSLVDHITGHGSGNSYDPMQPAGVKKLKDWQESHKESEAGA